MKMKQLAIRECTLEKDEVNVINIYCALQMSRNLQTSLILLHDISAHDIRALNNVNTNELIKLPHFFTSFCPDVIHLLMSLLILYKILR